VGLTNINHTSSPYQIYSPGFLLDARDGSKIFRASYQGSFGQYTHSQTDNYNDETVHSSFDWAVDPRSAFRVGYDFIFGHDARGATDRPEATAYPDKYRLSTPSILYAYGSPGAQGRVELFYSDASKRYTNNRATTFLSDRDTQEYGGTFYWRIMPRTHLLFDARGLDYDYVSDQSPQDSHEQRYYAGVTWEATAATSGTVKVGSFHKHFTTGGQTYNEASWEGLISWSPRTYSRFDFYTSRLPVESTGLGAYIISTPTGVIWTHSWNTLWSTSVNAKYQRDEYQGFDRTDDITSGGLSVAYKFRRWMTLGAEYTYTKRDSNQDVNDYSRNLWLVTAKFTL
jgi:hypothetical protein